MSGYLQLNGGGAVVGSALQSILMCDGIVPGSEPSYQICKEIYVSHPIGGKLAEAPIDLAQSQQREISVPDGPEDRVKEAFEREWEAIGADHYIFQTATLSRVYGIASLVLGAKDKPADKPLDPFEFPDLELYFNCLDPLNSAGSLVLDQNPNSPDFQRPRQVTVQGVAYHPSRTVVMLNGPPIYIEYVSSGFGFVGRSVYQRALFPLKTYLSLVVAIDMLAVKLGVLVAKMKQAGSIVDNIMQRTTAQKRELLKEASTGNVLSISTDESIEAIDLQNADKVLETALAKNLEMVATAAPMPAKLLNQETFAEGFGEGTEDAKAIVRYVNGIRKELAPLYRFFDRIVQHRAWSPAFYATIQNDFPEYRDKPYKTAFYEWQKSFVARWPSLIEEPDSEKVKVSETKLKSIISLIEVFLPQADPDNKARVLQWAADNFNADALLFSSPLELDWEALAAYEPPAPTASGPGETEPAPPAPEGLAGRDDELRMDDFNEADHPRGQPGNAGQFASGGGGGASGAHEDRGSSEGKQQAAPRQISAKSALTKMETSASGERTAPGGSVLPAHVVALKLPPAWTDVHYSDDPKSPLQAIGRDSKGREQRVYSKEFAASQAAAKFARIKELDREFSGVEAQNHAARQSDNPRTKAAADCAALVMSMGVRPGSEDDTQAKVRAYGATTLEGRHVVIGDDGRVSLQFIGKKGVALNLPVTDPDIARMLLERKAAAGDGGQLFGVNEKQLLDHVHSLDGGGFKTKDFRTLLGTRTAMQEVAKMPMPKNEKDYVKAVKAVASVVSKKLGNTPTVALQSYISPAVFGAWEAGYARSAA